MTLTLYFIRNGLLESLGQSQVFAYFREPSRDYRFTLITYEKEEDWVDTESVRDVRARNSRIWPSTGCRKGFGVPRQNQWQMRGCD